jgi:hypothetical protein
MCFLVGKTVKTQFADYSCATREEAEALYMSLRHREELREQARAQGKQVEPKAAIKAGPARKSRTAARRELEPAGN